MSSKNPTAAAEKQYRMWHQKHPHEVNEKTIQFPVEVYCLGTACDILYASDKWEDDGNFYDYSHHFDTHPLVYCEKADGKPKSVAKLLGVRDVEHGCLAMPELAEVKEFTFHDGKKEQRLGFGATHPLMSCSKDLKTLVIFASKSMGGPYFIRSDKTRSNPGGSTRTGMVVTERGIVG